MKIKISKSQWELLKYSQLDKISPEDRKFLNTLPPHVLKGIIEEIKTKSSSTQEIHQLIELLRKTEKQVMDRSPAPSLEQINHIIEQIKATDPRNPALQYFEDLQYHITETDKMISDDKVGTQKAIDNILDQFSQGKITKQQLQQSLMEFAKRKTNWYSMSKQAQGRMNRDQEDADIDKQQKVQKQEEEIKQEKLQIAKTILEQLGGNKFVAMTGAKNFISLGNGLSFKLPGAGFTKNGINYVKIILTPSDTYNIEFGRTRGTTYKVIDTANDIYFDVLQEVFTRETGLNTHL